MASNHTKSIFYSWQVHSLNCRFAVCFDMETAFLAGTQLKTWKFISFVKSTNRIKVHLNFSPRRWNSVGKKSTKLSKTFIHILSLSLFLSPQSLQASKMNVKYEKLLWQQIASSFFLPQHTSYNNSRRRFQFRSMFQLFSIFAGTKSIARQVQTLISLIFDAVHVVEKFRKTMVQPAAVNYSRDSCLGDCREEAKRLEAMSLRIFFCHKLIAKGWRHFRARPEKKKINPVVRGRRGQKTVLACCLSCHPFTEKV